MNNINTRIVTHPLGTSVNHTFSEPNYCTYCKHTMTPLTRNRYDVPRSNYIIISFTCSNHECTKVMIGTYEYQKSDKYKLELVNFFPNITLETLPELISNLSSNFDSAFKQANTAHQLGHLELAGAGYRNALEILVKDYAIIELKQDFEKVSKLSLYDAIGEYFPSFDFQISADMVRILGNDHTHYERKYDEIDFDVLKSYFDIFIQLVNTTLMITHPPVDKAHRDQ